MALKEIISNAELKDDAVLKIGDQEFKVGDLRAEFNAPPEGYVPREEYDKLHGQMGEMTQSVQALLSAAAKQTDAAEGAAPAQTPQEILRGAMASLLKEDGYNYDEDKYVGPAMRLARERARDESLKAADERYNPKLEKLEKEGSGLQKRLALTEGKLWYRQAKRDGEIPDNPQTKKPYTLQEIAALAFQHKILDADGWPDYDTVTERLNAPRKQQTEIEKAREEGRREMAKEIREGRRAELISLPGGRSARIGDTKPPIETAGKTAQQMFAEALGAAVQDPEILGELEEA